MSAHVGLFVYYVILLVLVCVQLRTEKERAALRAENEKLRDSRQVAELVKQMVAELMNNNVSCV